MANNFFTYAEIVSTARFVQVWVLKKRLHLN